MVEPSDSRVAVYIDFDNIVISRYDEVFGRGKFSSDKARSASVAKVDDKLKPTDPVARAVVDVGAILDYATSFGSVVISRAFADWSSPANSGYGRQLVNRAVELVQMFPTAAYQKNGADIRLAVDVVEDMFRLPDITHVLIVAGDSDFIPLAQRCKRLGRYVVGVGVAGATSRQLAAACNEFKYYGELPGVVAAPKGTEPGTAQSGTSDSGSAQSGTAGSGASKSRTSGSGKAESGTAGSGSSEPATSEASASAESVAEKAPTQRRASKPQQAKGRDVEHEAEKDPDEADTIDPTLAATQLLVRALSLGHDKSDEEWLHASSVKQQMMRIDPSFNEKTLGFRSFSAFVKSQSPHVEIDAESPGLIRLRESAGE